MPFMAWKMILSEALNSHNLIQRSSLPLTPLKLKFDAGKTFVLFIAAARCKAGARCATGLARRTCTLVFFA